MGLNLSFEVDLKLRKTKCLRQYLNPRFPKSQSKALATRLWIQAKYSGFTVLVYKVAKKSLPTKFAPYNFERNSQLDLLKPLTCTTITTLNNISLVRV